MKMTRRDVIKVGARASVSLVFGSKVSLSREVLMEKKISSTGEIIPVIGIGA